MFQAIVRLQRAVAGAAEWFQSPFLLAVRLYWGWQFIQTGWAKLHNLDGITRFFTTLGLPAPGTLATVVGALELTGGFLLVVGLFPRLISVPLTFSMFMAYAVANREPLFSIFSDPAKFYGADPYTFLFAAVLILIFGPGDFSADKIFESRRGTAPQRPRTHAAF